MTLTIEEITQQNADLQAQLAKERATNSELGKHVPPAFYAVPENFSTLSPVEQNTALLFAKGMNFTQTQFTQYIGNEISRAQRAAATIASAPPAELPKGQSPSGVFSATTQDQKGGAEVPFHEKLIEESVLAAKDIIRDANFSLSGVQLVSVHSPAAKKLNNIYESAQKHQKVQEYREMNRLSNEYK